MASSTGSGRLVTAWGAGLCAACRRGYAVNYALTMLVGAVVVVALPPGAPVKLGLLSAITFLPPSGRSRSSSCRAGGRDPTGAVAC